MEKKLLAIDISHGTTHDGPGLRTTVFVKGCSLRCRWCQNPESISMQNEPWWDETLCIGCMSCVKACPTTALKAGEKGFEIDREKCRKCGNCTAACPSTAMSLEAQEYSLEELIHELLKYKTHFDQFGGGVTCSGGEPLLQYEFIAELFKRLHEDGITTALDTCGCAPMENLAAVLPHTDYILYDMKIFDAEKHKEYTGQKNDKILENLLYAAEYIRNAGRPMEIWIRTPLIPGATADTKNIKAIGEYLKTNVEDVVTRWELCAFNGACASKYRKLGSSWEFCDIKTMSRSEINVLKEAAESSFVKDKIMVTGMIRPDEKE